MLNQTEDQLSELSLALKMYQEELAKLKSDSGKLVEKIEQLKKNPIEVIILIMYGYMFIFTTLLA